MFEDYSFFEFLNGEFEYYALVYAMTEADAIACYVEDVCEVEPESSPTKIGFSDGIKLIMEASIDDGDDSELFYLLKELYVQDKPQIVLISRDLI